MLSLLLSLVLVSSPNIPTTIHNPEDIHTWLKTFTYQKEDIGDSWKSPAQTIKDQGGDCEDFAFLVQYALKKIGYNSYVVGMRGFSSGHAICVFQEGKYWSIFSNDVYIQTTKETWLETVILYKHLAEGKYFLGEFNCQLNHKCEKSFWIK